MELANRWLDIALDEKAVEILKTLHESGSVSSVLEIARVIGIHQELARRRIVGAKRRRNKLMHLVRYVRKGQGRKGAVTITIHGRFLWHAMKVYGLPSVDFLRILAKCAVLSARMQARREIMPENVGEFKNVWEEIERCEFCRSVVSNIEVIKLRPEEIDACMVKVQGQPTLPLTSTKPTPNFHQTSTKPTPDFHQTSTKLPPNFHQTSTTSFKPSTFKPRTLNLEPSTQNLQSFGEILKEMMPIGETTEEKTNKKPGLPDKCPRCGQQRTKYALFTCHDPRVREKNIQLKIWHLQLVCHICHEELSDIKWRIIEEGKFK